MDLLGGGLGRGQGQERQGEKAQHGLSVVRWAGVVNEGDGIGDALKVVLGQVISGSAQRFHSGGAVRQAPASSKVMET